MFRPDGSLACSLAWRLQTGAMAEESPGSPPTAPDSVTDTYTRGLSSLRTTSSPTNDTTLAESHLFEHRQGQRADSRQESRPDGSAAETRAQETGAASAAGGRQISHRPTGLDALASPALPSGAESVQPGVQDPVHQQALAADDDEVAWRVSVDALDEKEAVSQLMALSAGVASARGSQLEHDAIASVLLFVLHAW